ncbi:protein of unknown function [uncultured Woeseiaceae bacterium]|uniref:Uncharacterized protein n=1 Tax=uncultured Woeseiaceae bacterium TaxID=1983305 RepID=A0A7D9D547_9GAMM|nr:protein of unknown function [uncultured Woeseiaceae bacterium]
MDLLHPEGALGRDFRCAKAPLASKFAPSEYVIFSILFQHLRRNQWDLWFPIALRYAVVPKKHGEKNEDTRDKNVRVRRA